MSEIIKIVNEQYFWQIDRLEVALIANNKDIWIDIELLDDKISLSIKEMQQLKHIISLIEEELERKEIK